MVEALWIYLEAHWEGLSVQTSQLTSDTYLYMYIYIYVYVHAAPTVVHTSGPCEWKFAVDSLGLKVCMDESLSHSYLSLAVSHGFVAWQTCVKAKSTGHSHRQSESQPISEQQKSLPRP